ncbi:uncharacterized protein [Ptychodera flava]|uniref:uncharacterized protein n=1 Tax=Ptychodera flava TaxID=63121 RepID=UPI00396A5005
MAQTKSKMFSIGVAAVVIGGVLLLFGSVCMGVCWMDGFYKTSGGPIWTGILAIASGCIGIYASKTDKIENLSVAFLVLNIFIILCTVFVSIGAIVGAVHETWLMWFGVTSGFVIHILICMVSIALMVVACVGAINHCGGGERRTEVVVVSHVPMQQPAVQVVHQSTGVYTTSGPAQPMQPMYASHFQPAQPGLPGGTMGYDAPPQYAPPQQAPPYTQMQPQQYGGQPQPPQQQQVQPQQYGQAQQPQQYGQAVPVTDSNI